MTYNEFMNRPVAHKRRILHKIEDVRLKEAACFSATAHIAERVQTSPSNTSEMNYARYIDAKNDLQRLLEGLEAVQNEVRIFLYANLDPCEADILEWKYIDDKSMLQISEILSISYDSVKGRMKRADKKAQKIYEKNAKTTQMTENDPA